MMLFTTTTACRVSRNNVALSPPCRIRSSSVAVKRSYMSTQTLLAPEEDPRMMLILGKPGGGKGTISNKILKVRVCVATTILQVKMPIGTLLGGCCDCQSIVPETLQICSYS